MEGENSLSPDIYVRVTEAAPKILDGLITALEIRAADPPQRAMLHTYLSDAALPSDSRVLEIGCGTGAVTRVLAAWPGVAEAIGVDPSPVFVTKARELARGVPRDLSRATRRDDVEPDRTPAGTSRFTVDRHGDARTAMAGESAPRRDHDRGHP